MNSNVIEIIYKIHKNEILFYLIGINNWGYSDIKIKISINIIVEKNEYMMFHVKHRLYHMSHTMKIISIIYGLRNLSISEN